MQVCHSRDVAT